MRRLKHEVLVVNAARYGFALFLTFAISASLSGCKSGVQGGDIPASFGGIDAATAISPTAVQLNWTLSKQFVSYKVYQGTSSTPLKTETFQSTLISGLSPASTYQYSVSAVDTQGVEKSQGTFTPVTTYTRFAGITNASLSLAGATTVNVAWTNQGSNITYKIYQKIQTDSWSFTVPVATVTGVDHYQVLNLAEGTPYCYFVQANYQDASFEPATTAADATSGCITTTSDLQGLPTVIMNPVAPGAYPWFEAVSGQPAMSTEIWEGSIRVAARTGNGSLRAFNAQTPGTHNYYALVSQTVSGVLKRAKVNLTIKDGKGVAQQTALVRQLQELNAVYPRLVSGGKGVQRIGAQIVKGDFNCDGIPDIAVSAPLSTPYVDPQHVSQMGAVVIYYGEQYIPSGTTNVLYRIKADVAPSVSGIAPFPQLIYYPVSYANFHFGTKLAVGNFNGDCKKFDPVTPANSISGACDYLYATYGATNTLDSMGNVVANTTRLSDMKLIYTCDDLAVAIDPTSGVTSNNSTGGVFVIYGDPNSGLVSGSGALNYGINEATCDSTSGTCRAGRFNHVDSTNTPTANVMYFGRSLGVGDFNNDGFDDLAVGSVTAATATTGYGRVTVLRGSNQGLLPTSNANANADILPSAFSPSPAGGSYTASVITAGQGTNPATLSSFLDPATTGFAWSLAGVPHSRDCSTVTATPGATASAYPSRLQNYSTASPKLPTDSGFDFSKCADLVISDPARNHLNNSTLYTSEGSVFTCQAKMSNATVSTVTEAVRRKIDGWQCQEAWPFWNDNGTNTWLNSGAMFGFSLLGVDNQNGYPYTQIPSGSMADIYGALFVGAPYADVAAAGAQGVSAGKVFGFYSVPSKKSSGIYAILASGGGGAGQVLVQTIPAIPCNQLSTNNQAGSNSMNQCDNQTIYNSAPQSGERFGYALGSAFQHKVDAPELPKLMISAPYRNVLGDSGQIAQAGAVFVYKGDLSVLGSNTQPRIESAGSCSSDGCTHFSGGLNPFGPSLLYDKTVTAAAHFGMYGSAGDNFEGATNPAEVDVVTSAAEDNTPVQDSGIISVFDASSGFPPTMSVASRQLQDNVSKEINYRFEEAKVVGDINGDGYADVVARIKVGSSRAEIAIFYGSANGLVTGTPSLTATGLNPRIISSGSDALLGVKYYAVGDVNGDGFNDIMLVGNIATYIYYGSGTGLVTNSEPALNPVGKNPLKFALSTGGSAYAPIYFHGGLLQGDGTQTAPYYDVSLQSVAYGDYNADGYSDIALGLVDTGSLPSGVDAATTAAWGAKQGRVVIIYGSATGPQVGSLGYIRRQTAVAATGLADVSATSACNGAAINVCHVQMVGPSDSGTQSTPVSDSLMGTQPNMGFGWSLATITSMEGTGNKADGLVVGDPSAFSGDGEVYYFRGSLTGLQTNQSAVQYMNSANNGGKNRFGYMLAGVGDINKDGYADLAVSAPINTGSNASGVYVFYGTNASGTGAFYGETTTGTKVTVTSPITLPTVNNRFTSATSPSPQLIRPTTLASDNVAQFGMGIASIGDFNGDGYADLLVNVASGDYQLDVLKAQAGYGIIYFGSALGLRSDASPATTPACYGAGNSDETCEPFWFYLPNNNAYENTYVSSQAAGDINGDGHPDVIIGGFGRNHSSGLAFSSGVFYVLY